MDKRMVGWKPSSRTFAEAVALPLTSITAWEALFDRLAVPTEGEDAGKRLLIVGGAGGVESIAMQLVKRVAGLEVIATASRGESSAWCLDLGADHVVNHREDIPKQRRGIGIDAVEFVLVSTARTSTGLRWLKSLRLKVASVRSSRRLDQSISDS